eukprot:2569993-Lingulodinium_polyedra.AAC.1
MVACSLFSTTLVHEVATFAAEPPAVFIGQEVFDEFRKVSSQVFLGWGQTKIIEDSLSRLRDRESRDAEDKLLNLKQQFAAPTGHETMALHRRQELRAPSGGPPGARLGKEFFSVPPDFACSIDATSLEHKADWPIFSPQTAKG